MRSSVSGDSTGSGYAFIMANSSNCIIAYNSVSNINTGVATMTGSEGTQVFGNAFNTLTIGLNIGAGTANRAYDNTFTSVSIPISVAGGYRGTWKDNKGYNPVGHIATPWDNTNHLVVDSGGSASPSNATAMTVTQSPKLVIVTIGSRWDSAHTLVIRIDGTQIISTTTPGANTVYSFGLDPGQTFYIQYQTSQATFVVSGR